MSSRFSEFFFEFSSFNLVEASFLSFGFLLGFFGFDGICFRGIEPEEDFPGMSTVSNTEFSAALAKVLVAKGSCRS